MVCHAEWPLSVEDGICHRWWRSLNRLLQQSAPSLPWSQQDGESKFKRFNYISQNMRTKVCARISSTSKFVGKNIPEWLHRLCLHWGSYRDEKTSPLQSFCHGHFSVLRNQSELLSQTTCHENCGGRHEEYLLAKQRNHDAVFVLSLPLFV